jgi:hypothetical protein
MHARAHAGKMSAPWPVDRPAPFVLLLHHVSRLWDYDASPTAQLKTWLARLLLMQGNPGAQVWTRSAAAPAARDPGGLGPYSMPLAQAGAHGGGGALMRKATLCAHAVWCACAALHAPSPCLSPATC